MRLSNPILKKLLRYVEETYAIQPDFLWSKTPDNAAFRHKITNKWFAALITNLPRQKLGLAESDTVDILNVKCDPVLSASLIDGTRFFKGYHMNKEHWLTILLDGSVPLEEITALLDMSYELTRPKRKSPVK